VPLYEFRCQSCGSFDLRRDMQDASDVATCPSCDRTARRVYSVPAFRLENGPLRDAAKADRGRLDRARSGQPVTTGPPTGRRLSRPSGHHHH
jgi:putative FmdB family regulatory protein